MRAGRSGGVDAADLLAKSIKGYIALLDTSAGQWSIVVRVYAHFSGLADYLSRSGFIDSAANFVAFAGGFTQHQPLFDFVDVGSGKERADHKIKGRKISYPS